MKNRILVILIFTVALFLRLYQLTENPPALHVDEAYMTQSALALIDGSEHPLESYYSITRIGNWMTTIFISLFGLSFLTIRLSSVLYGMVTLVFLYLFCKEEFNQRVALISLFVASVSHVFLAYSRMSLPNIQAPLLLMVVLYALHKGLKKNNLKWIVVAGITAGLSMYSYTGARLIPALGLVFLAFHLKSVGKKQWVTYLFTFFLFAVPLFSLTPSVDNYLSREVQVNLTNRDGVPVFIYIENFLINLCSVIDCHDRSVQYANGTILDVLSSIFLLVTIGIYMFSLAKGKKYPYSYKKQVSFLLACFFIIVATVSFTDYPPQSQRLIIYLPLICILIALGIEKFYYLVLDASTKTAARMTIAVIVISISAINIYTLFIKYPNRLQNPYTWIEPATSIAEYNRSHQDKTIYFLESDFLPLTFGTLDVLSRGIQPMRPYLDSTVIDQNSQIIIPLIEPYNRLTEKKIHYDRISEFKKEGYTVSFVEDERCPDCFTSPLFAVISAGSPSQ